MMQVTSAATFLELKATVLKLIADTDTQSDNKSNPTIEDGRRLIIAIENARNMYLNHPPEQPTEAEKVEEFKRMIACLQKVDHRRDNLQAAIFDSINSGTAKGWIPKLHSVTPSHIVPSSKFCLTFFGRFKYAAYKPEVYKPTFQLHGETFEATKVTEHAIVFDNAFKNSMPVYQENRCTQLEGRLIVPYETGTLLKDIKTFEFEVVIRALPTTAGKVVVTHQSEKKRSKQELTTMQVGWNQSYTLTCPDAEFKSVDFISFDGQKSVLMKEGEVPYLKLSRQNPKEQTGWIITTIPPSGL